MNILCKNKSFDHNFWNFWEKLFHLRVNALRIENNFYSDLVMQNRCQLDIMFLDHNEKLAVNSFSNFENIQSVDFFFIFWLNYTQFFVFADKQYKIITCLKNNIIIFSKTKNPKKHIINAKLNERIFVYEFMRKGVVS